MELLTFLLTSAPVLMFVTGVVAALGKSNLKIPESLGITLNLYLLLAIGLKGGMGLASVSFDDLALPLAVTLVLGMVLPLVAFGLGGLFKFSFHERIAMAATFGSVSLVTYVAAAAQLERLGIVYEPFMTTLVVVLEILVSSSRCCYTIRRAFSASRLPRASRSPSFGIACSRRASCSSSPVSSSDS